MNDIRQVLADYDKKLRADLTDATPNGSSTFDGFSIYFIRGFWNSLVDEWGADTVDHLLNIRHIPHEYPEKVAGPYMDVCGAELRFKNPYVYIDPETNELVIRGEDIYIGFNG